MRDEHDLEREKGEFNSVVVCITLFGMGCFTGYCVARAVQEMLL